MRFAYFDPHQVRYEVLKSAPITIHSEGSAEEEGLSYGLSRRDIEAVGEDIRYIKPDAESPRRRLHVVQQLLVLDLAGRVAPSPSLPCLCGNATSDVCRAMWRTHASAGPKARLAAA